MTSHTRVRKMAAVGCLERGSRQEGIQTCDREGHRMLELVRKNGVNRTCLRIENSANIPSSNGVILDSFCKLNNSLKNGSFTKPSTPSLRPRGEKVQCIPEPPRRKRRHSRHEKNDTNKTILSEEAGVQCQLTCTDLYSNKDICITEEKDLSCLKGEKCLNPISPGVSRTAEGGFCNPLSPDNSRSCTPSSMTGTSSNGGKHVRTPSTDSQSSVPVKLQCHWKNCDHETETSTLMDHIQLSHVETQKGDKYMCLWHGCKVFEKKSSSKSWLDRHILCHSGDKPFRCIVDGCKMSFTSQKGLERHVNGHFNVLQTSNQKVAKSREDTPTKLCKRRRVKRSRPFGVKPIDFFDAGIMEKIQEELTSITERSQIDLNSSSNSVTFHSSILATRTEASGKVKVLMHWTPENVIPDSWILESEASNFITCVIPLSKLPHESLESLYPNLYHRHRYRKNARK